MITGHGCFNQFSFRIRWTESPTYSHCEAGAENIDQHILTICPAWETERNDLIGADLNLGSLFEGIIASCEKWLALASFCEKVMIAKEKEERERQRVPVHLGS